MGRPEIPTALEVNRFRYNLIEDKLRGINAKCK